MIAALIIAATLAWCLCAGFVIAGWDLIVLAFQLNHDEAIRRRLARRDKGDAGELGAWGDGE